MNSLKHRTRHIIDKRSNKALVITRPPLQVRAVLLERSLVAFTDREYVEARILRGVQELRQAFTQSGQPFSLKTGQIRIAKIENKNTIDRAFTRLVDMYVLPGTAAEKNVGDSHFSVIKLQDDKE